MGSEFAENHVLLSLFVENHVLLNLWEFQCRGIWLGGVCTTMGQETVVGSLCYDLQQFWECFVLV